MTSLEYMNFNNIHIWFFVHIFLKFFLRCSPFSFPFCCKDNGLHAKICSILGEGSIESRWRGSHFLNWHHICLDIWCIKKNSNLKATFFMTKHKRIICNYVNIIYFAVLNSLENPESYSKKKKISANYTVYWWQSSCTTQLTLSYIGKKSKREKKKKKRLAGTKKVYWCIHQIQKTNRKLASRKISNNSQWGKKFSEE